MILGMRPNFAPFPKLGFIPRIIQSQKLERNITMGLKIIYGKSGSGKSEYCYQQIAENIKNEEKIYLITQEQF